MNGNEKLILTNFFFSSASISSWVGAGGQCAGRRGGGPCDHEGGAVGWKPVFNMSEMTRIELMATGNISKLVT